MAFSRHENCVLKSYFSAPASNFRQKLLTFFFLKIIISVLYSFSLPSLRINNSFQVTTRRINFIVDNGESNAAVDGLDSVELRDGEKDRSWLMSSLHQIYSRR